MASQIPEKSRSLVRLRDMHRCVRCNGSAIPGEWHHRRSRSIRDGEQHAASNGILLCGSCHRWVHANPFEARASGWIVSRYSIPSEHPVMRRGEWIMLGVDGSATQCEAPA